MRARVRSFGKAALLALPFRIFSGCTLSDVSTAPVPDPLRQPYDFALRVLAEVPEGPEVLSDHLRSLRPALAALRRSYRANTVRVHYEDPATACAYLLAYIPHYIKQAAEAFEFTKFVAYRPRTLKIGFFCTGPSPESVALAHHLRGRLWSHDLEIHLFDDRPRTWDLVGEPLRRLGCSHQWPEDVRFITHQADLGTPAGLQRHLDVIGELDLAMFQNCLNELATDGFHRPAEVLVSLTERLREGATLIVSDLSKYEGNQRILSEAGPGLARLGPVTSTSASFRIDPPGPETDLGRYFFDIHQTSNDRAWPRVNNNVTFLVLERENGS